ncbi:MAG: hypothetical protein KQH83_05740 [Actinobacteria bacterium]|nr:hypothetical protein [Actinomycetota bacterium]
MTTGALQQEPLTGSSRLQRLRHSPVAFVFLVAPALGELLSSSSPLPWFLAGWLPLATLYGCGALLIREASVRWGTGWTAIVLLGMAYGIYEEGLVVRSFFDPAWGDLGALAVYGRAAGVNWLWAELLTLFHAAVPVAATLVLAEVAFPAAKGRPWLGRRGLLWCAAGVGVWLPIGTVGLMDAAGVHLAAAAAAVAVLVLASRRARSPLLAPRAVRVPRPRWFFGAGLVGTTVLFLGIYGPAEAHLEETGTVAPAWLTGLAVAAGVALVGWWVVRRSGAGGSWDDRHRTALVGGALTPMAVLSGFGGGPLGPVVGAGALAGLWWAHRTARRRYVEGVAV